MQLKICPPLAVAGCTLLAIVLSGCATTFTLPRTNQPGFGDRQNDYAWGMTWFKGKLYVGTSRNEMCVEGATTQFYARFSNPNAQTYSTSPGPGVTCPASLDDLYATLQAEIWQYDPSAASPNTPQSGWKNVYQSPAVQNPDAAVDSTPKIGRDIAFRAASVVNFDGVSTLVFSGVTAGEFLRSDDGKPRVPAPRLLTTTDGLHFKEFVYSGQIDISDWQTTPPLPEIHYPMGFRSVVQFGQHIMVVASDSLTGDGVLMEFNPKEGIFRQVSSLRVFEIEVFNDQVYVGTADPSSGYGVYRSDLRAKDSRGHYAFTPVVTGGAGRGGRTASVISMHPFKGRLYVGACGWYNGGGCELIRIKPDNTWDLSVGGARTYNGVLKTPLSGLTDGFDNFFNVHFWRIGDHNGALYVGTNDASWLFQNDPILGPLLSFEYGFDIFGSCDGQNWVMVTNNAFGDDSAHNFGARNFAHAPHPDLAFVGSANHAGGASVYQVAHSTLCDPADTPVRGHMPSSPLTFTAPTALTDDAPAAGPSVPPRHFAADAQSCATFLSWDVAPNAVQYEIYRAPFNRTRATMTRKDGMQLPAELAQTMFAQFFGRTVVPSGTLIAGAYEKIGASPVPYLADRSAPAGAGPYAYAAVAVDRQGNRSALAISATVEPRPSASVAALSAPIWDLVQRGRIPAATSQQAVALLSRLETAVAHGDQPGALSALSGLGSLVHENRSIDPRVADELDAVISNLTHQIRLATADCTGGSAIGWGRH